jgi:hypothetical protein
MPEYEALIAVTRTGAVVDALPSPVWSFDEPLAWSDLGKATLTVPLPGADRAGQLTRSTLRGLREGMSALSIAVVRDDTCLWAGPVYTLGWDDDQVSIGCASLGKLLDRRVCVAEGYWADPTNAAANFTLAMSARDQVITLLDMATTGPRRGLPITLPDLDGQGGMPTDYLGMDLRTVYEAIGDLSDADGGPDVALVPAISNDHASLSWAAQVGTPTIGYDNSDATWDYPSVALSGDVDDSETVDTAYVPGNAVSGGDNNDARAIGVATRDRGEPWPALERADRTSVSETRQPQLDALARSYRDAYALPIEEITSSVPTEQVPPYRDAWNLGDVIRYVINGHPWLDDGTVLTRRVVAVSVDPDTIKLTTTEA